MQAKKQDPNIKKIEEFFRVPDKVADKVQNIAEKVKGGYILIETRPHWNGSPGPWTKSPVAKIVFHKPTQFWNLYWMRASGRWELYGKYKSLEKILTIIELDEHGCFFG